MNFSDKLNDARFKYITASNELDAAIDEIFVPESRVGVRTKAAVLKPGRRSTFSRSVLEVGQNCQELLHDVIVECVVVHRFGQDNVVGQVRVQHEASRFTGYIDLGDIAWLAAPKEEEP